MMLCQLQMQRYQLSIPAVTLPRTLQVGRDANPAWFSSRERPRTTHPLYMHRHVPWLCGNCVLSVDMAV